MTGVLATVTGDRRAQKTAGTPQQKSMQAQLMTMGMAHHWPHAKLGSYTASLVKIGHTAELLFSAENPY